MISRQEAEQIALAYALEAKVGWTGELADASGEPAEPTVAEVKDLTEVGRHPMIYGLQYPLSSCWIAYLNVKRLQLQSSRIVLVSKDSGAVVYMGSAYDEG